MALGAETPIEQLIDVRRQYESVLEAREGAKKRQTLEFNREALRERCRDLPTFIKEAWPAIEPATRYIPGRHADVIAEHLTAVFNGQIRRIVINIPPGFSKSTLVSVLFPMWVWGPMGRPGHKFVGLAHERSLGIRDNMKCRRLVASDWYQTLWGDSVKLTADQNEKLNFENTGGGFRQVATIENITGRRGDTLLLDDLISVENANSEVERKKVALWMQESMPTRMNDPELSSIILIMQRIHEDDPTGIVLAKNWGWDHLMLPMRFEESRRCVTSLGIADWRTYEGELLFPERFPEKVVSELEDVLGEYAAAGQLQQRPAPREGGMFKVDKIEIVSHAPAGGVMVRGWDLAASKGATSPYTAGGKLLLAPDGYLYIMDMRRKRASPFEAEAMIDLSCDQDGLDVRQSIPQDPGQAGVAQKQHMAKKFGGKNFRFSTERGSKEQRAVPLSSQVDAGMVRMVKGDWNSALVEEMRNFPNGRYKDQVDALTRAYAEILSYRVDEAGESPETASASEMNEDDYGDGDDDYWG